MAETRDYIVKTTSTRELHIKKQADGNYQVRLYWRKGDKDLATLILEPGEMKRLADTAAGLLKK
jgi:hypothetical protein